MRNLTRRALLRLVITFVFILLLQIPHQKISSAGCMVGRLHPFSPDETVLAADVNAEGIGWSLAVWDMASGKLLRIIGPASSSIIDISADSKFLVAGSPFDTVEAVIWEISTGEKLQTFPYPSEAYLHVKFSPDGKYLLTYGLYDPTGAILWNIATGKRLHTFPTPDWLKFSANGKYLLLQEFSEDNLSFWEVTTGRKLKSFKSASNGAITPDSQLAVINQDDIEKNDYALVFWDIPKNLEIKTVVLTEPQLDSLFSQGTGADYSPYLPEFSSDGSYLLLNGSFASSVWNVREGKQLYTVDGAAHFSLDGKKLIVYKRDPSYFEMKRLITTVVNVKTGKTIQTKSLPIKEPNIQVSPYGTYIAVFGQGESLNEVELWDSRTGKILWTLTC